MPARTPARRQPVTRRTTPTKPAPTRPIVPPPDPDLNPPSQTEIATAAARMVRPAEVIIDGIRYAPADGTSGLPKVGVAITTHNRNDLLADCLKHWRAHTPAAFPLLIIDDASDKPVDAADHRFDTQQGVPVAKNKCFELLMRAGVDHLFLADDDIHPVVDDWWRPYVDSPEPHLAHSWNLVKVGEDDHHTAWHASGGPLLYYTRQVIADVGGMRTDFGQPNQPAWGCEHVNQSDRIFNRGWTSWRYADVKGADRLFHEYDRNISRNGHKSTATTAQREHNATKGRDLWRSRIETDHAYVEYRTDADVILTCLFTDGQARQSNRSYKPTLRLLTDLADSIRHGRMIVFHDQLQAPTLTTGNNRPVEFVQTDCRMNVFFQRWQTYWQWLRQHPEIARVWCVDGTDVTQLRDPFTGLEPSKLHLGWEPTVLGSQWFGPKVHPERRARAFLDAHPGAQVLNPGLVGGDRTVVMEFAHRMAGYLYDLEIDAAQGWQSRTTATVAGGGDMSAANMIAYTHFADRLVTGSQIATVFKAHEEKDNGYSLWKHK